jgi:hypothetical protein
MVIGRLVERVLECVGNNRIDPLVIGALQRWSFRSFPVGSPCRTPGPIAALRDPW